ncbi:aspartic proteinase NANA, chloroplast-like [Mangifera indica]|uniref:aspartic proteinase NANA, chloroplast-like n=1 Tax=Mangifera indica TaxID=29780 RepID=UPI001CFBFE37|nr:aspartic proteinase NANA, chloroplast-like [Mangifera indica]
MVKGRPCALLMISLVFIIQCSTSAFANSHSSSMRMELIHRHALYLNTRPKTQLELMKDLFHSDIIRQKMIAHKRRLSLSPIRDALETTNTSSTAIEMPLRAGRDCGTGVYFVQMKVGTPAQKFTLVVDTGSELTWVNCRYKCGADCTTKGRLDKRRVFKADFSSSFKTVACFSHMCKIELMNLFSLTRCPMPSNPCAYDFRYVDGSEAMGIFAMETVTLGLANGQKLRLKNVLIGCSDSFQGQSFVKADGVMGLAYGKYTFAKTASEIFYGKFSYCLVDHLSHKNVSNYIIFGSNNNESSSILGKKRYTKLQLGLLSPFYAVNVIGMSIGGVMLKIPVQVWDANSGGGTIVDSGSSLIFLAEPAYNPVMAALQMSVSKFQRLVLKGVPMDYCFNSTGYDEKLVPSLVIHFADGARFEPHKKSYMIDVAAGVKCVGFVSVAWPGISTIGNILQQNYLWEFDLAQSKLGFVASTCT